MKKTFSCIGLTTMVLIVGCILNDELTTIVIRPDGSADWVRFRSNIRSSVKGEKGAQELLKFIEDFEAQRGDDFDRIKGAGGEILDFRWVQREEPYSTLLTARFPNAATVERFWTIKGELGEVVVQTHLIFDHNHRRLSLKIPAPSKSDLEERGEPSLWKFRRDQANGISETRIVVANGEIISSEGFIVADDLRSCLIDTQRIDELLRRTHGEVEVFVEWEVNPESHQ